MRSTPHSVRRCRMKSATSSATMPPSDEDSLYDVSPGGLPRQNIGPGSVSEIDEAHVRIPVSRGRALRKRALDACEVVRGQPDIRSGRVLLEVADALRARDRDDVLALREHP